MRSKVRAYSHQGHGPRADRQAGYISATSDATPSLANGSRFSNRSSFVKAPFKSSARVMVLFAVSTAAATSGAVRSAGIARSITGLRLITCPPAGHAIACTLARERHRCPRSCELASIDYAAVALVQRNGSPDRQTVCRITDSLRANATRALPGPERRSIASAQSFRCSDRFTR